MAPVQTRRSRKLREATYIDGQQNSVMKEISTPNKDGTIPLLNFLENTTKFMHDTRQLHSRIAYLEKEAQDYKQLQKKHSQLYNNVQRIIQSINNIVPEDEQLSLEEEHEEEEEEESTISTQKEAIMETHIPSYFESNAKEVTHPYQQFSTQQYMQLPETSSESAKKQDLELIYKTQHANNTMNFSVIPQNDEGASKKETPHVTLQRKSRKQRSYWDILNEHLKEDNQKLEEDMEKMELLSEEMKTTRNWGKSKRKSTKLHDYKSKLYNERSEKKKDFSLKKSSRGAKLRKIYEANISLNKKMAEEMLELEQIRQQLLEDDDEKSCFSNIGLEEDI